MVIFTLKQYALIIKKVNKQAQEKISNFTVKRDHSYKK